MIIYYIPYIIQIVHTTAVCCYFSCLLMKTVQLLQSSSDRRENSVVQRLNQEKQEEIPMIEFVNFDLFLN